MTTPPTNQPESQGFAHVTVLRDEVVRLVAEAPALQGPPGEATGWLVDATLGGGGHSEALLLAFPGVSVLGLDRDPAALQAASQRLARFGPRFACEHARFGQIAEVVQRRQLPPLAGVIADLGVSSHQLDTPERGFSFRFDAPLDMRMDPTRGEPVSELLARVSVEDLANVLYDYGDIRRSIGTAKIVLQALQAGARTTGQLAEALAKRLPRSRSMHPATQVFQALRIWVNRELDELEALLRDAPGLLAPGGVLAVISFHSGEDRMVKHALQALAPGGKYGAGGEFVRLTRKPVVAGPQEGADNPRARSAKLRAVRKKLVGETFGKWAEDQEEGEEDAEEVYE